ncbi:MAG: zinc-ribbon domain-containing protein [Myxococcales bacterium]|nr:zinc-ribbon domain-containing protein [Myxococcales bacterium]
MDVTCDRCGTEYEFDETLVTAKGTNVKCTNCGFVFRVFLHDGNGAKTWSIRQADGKTVTLASLRDLQQLIATGELTPTDQISRSGEAWKPLGDIAELRAFFDAAAAERGESPFTQAPSSPPPSGRPSGGPR